MNKIKTFNQKHPIIMGIIIFLSIYFILYMFSYGNLLPYKYILILPSIVTCIYVLRKLIFIIYKQAMYSKQFNINDNIDKFLAILFLLILSIVIIAFFTMIGFRFINLKIISICVHIIRISFAVMLILLIIKKLKEKK